MLRGRGGLLTRRGDPQGGVVVVLSVLPGQSGSTVTPASKIRLRTGRCKPHSAKIIFYLLLTWQVEAGHSLKTKHLHILHNNGLIMQARLAG